MRCSSLQRLAAFAVRGHVNKPDRFQLRAAAGPGDAGDGDG